MRKINIEKAIEITKRYEEKAEKEHVGVDILLREKEMDVMDRGPEKEYDFGYIYYYGLMGVEEDKNRGLYSLCLAAHSGNKDAEEIVRAAYEEGEPEAYYAIGAFYRFREKEYDKAQSLFLKAAEKGYVPALEWLSCGYDNPEKIDGKPLIRVYCLIEESALGGCVQSMRLLGDCHMNGIGCEKSKEEAISWYKKAGDLGDSESMLVLAKMCEEDDPERAFQLYMRGARLSNSKCAYEVAYSYDEGRGTEKDEKEAFRWYKEAGRLGNTEAMLVVAGAYEHGYYGVYQDPEKAVCWYMKAVVEKEDAEAMDKLSILCEQGYGGDDGPQIAFRCYLEEYLQVPEWNRGLDLMARCYETGWGVEKDPEKAAELRKHYEEEEERRHLGYLELLRLYGDRANPRDESMDASHDVEEKRAKTFTGTNDK